MHQIIPKRILAKAKNEASDNLRQRQQRNQQQSLSSKRWKPEVEDVKQPESEAGKIKNGSKMIAPDATVRRLTSSMRSRTNTTGATNVVEAALAQPPCCGAKNTELYQQSTDRKKSVSLS